MWWLKITVNIRNKDKQWKFQRTSDTKIAFCERHMIYDSDGYKKANLTPEYKQFCGILLHFFRNFYIIIIGSNFPFINQLTIIPIDSDEFVLSVVFVSLSVCCVCVRECGCVCYTVPLVFCYNTIAHQTCILCLSPLPTRQQ